MVDTTGEIWHGHHNVSECYYHLQLTVKYRKGLPAKEIERVIVEMLDGLKDRYEIHVHTVGSPKNHVHILCRFLPKYSAGQVIRLIKSITAREIFRREPSVKQRLWGGEIPADGYYGYYVATVSGRGDRQVIEEYVRNQGRQEAVKQLKLFEL